MATIKLFNSLTNKKEVFQPIEEGKVSMYTCGPTVYSYVTIGNWRTYVLSDLLSRSLQYFNYKVTHVMNITDVGHLTDDADSGEDKLEKAALKERKTAWEIANHYTDEFLSGLEKLNILKPDVLPKATEHIDEQIKLIKKIELMGFAYQTSDGIYFDVQQFEKKGNNYGDLSTLDEIKPGARVEKNLEKKDPRDFALWKFSPTDKKRDMEWPSPWGKGFPGWHIECSAMSMKYLGEQFDIHVGGEDLRSTHHPNEIAQAEAATGKKPFVKYWIHGAFLLIDGGKMSKSLGNAYNLADIINEGFNLLDLRYFYLTGHYRKQINFSWDGLANSRRSRNSLLNSIPAGKKIEKTPRVIEIETEFKQALANDLNVPQALAVFWEGLKKDLSEGEKRYLAEKFDRVLGLDLIREEKEINIPAEVVELVGQRETVREEGDWDQADELRLKIESKGYQVIDAPSGYQIKPLDESRGE